MLEKTHTPAALLLGALAGVLAATLCILGSAAWMAKQGCSASMAWPLATVSVCVGYPWQSLQSARPNRWLLKIGVALVAGLNPTSHDTS